MTEIKISARGYTGYLHSISVSGYARTAKGDRVPRYEIEIDISGKDRVSMVDVRASEIEFIGDDVKFENS